jgi:hypothetical protein
MHCMSILKKGAFFLIIPMLLLNACKHSGNTNVFTGDDTGSGYPSDGSRAEFVTEDVISIADVAGTIFNGAYIGSTSNSLPSNCASVATDTISIPHTLIIRFGDNDCTCFDGRKRKGTIVVSYFGEYTDTASTHIITFSNYFINDNQVTGSIQTTRKDTTITGNWYYNVTVNDSLNMSQDPLKSQFVIWTGNLVRKWVSGYSTIDRTQFVFSISGSATLIRPNGHSFSFAIATPLQVAIGCNFVQSGLVNVTGYSGARVLNYGTGSCDALAQLKIGVNVNDVTLVQ